MTAFDLTRGVEAQSLAILMPYLLEESNGRLVLTSKGTLARYLQETVGDMMMNTPDGRLWTVEFKAELENLHGNFFFETWSNRNLEDRASHAQRGSNVGWLAKLRADLLFYHFIDDDDLYIFDFFKLKRWAFGAGGRPGRLYDFKEKLQSKYTQLNDTWGRCAPIDVVLRELKPRHIHPRRLTLFKGEAA